MASGKIYNAIPDVTLVGSIILAYLLDRYLPVVNIVPFPANLIGWLIIVVGLGLAIYIIAALRAQHTSTDAAGMPSRLVTRGFFSFSRNPFYLLYVIVAFGAACVLGSLAAFIAPIICFVVLDIVIIPVEEEHMQKKFGADYERYKRSVHKWI